jgi:hypothetical protein
LEKRQKSKKYFDHTLFMRWVILFLYFRSPKKIFMRLLIFVCLAAFLSACNSSSSKKEPKQAMDDTARIDSPVVNTTPVVAIVPVKITAAQLPASIKVKGKLNEAWQWTDKLGENILVTSFVEPYDVKGKNKEENDQRPQSAELHAAQYVKKGDGYVLQWKKDEIEKYCLYDMTCEFIKDATTVTDLDNDGVAETTMQYRMACRGDVDPANLKLIIHEDTATYYLQGLCWVKISDEDKFTVTEKNANLETLPGYKKTNEEYLETFGRYESEKGFAGAPPEFLPYARKQWIKFVIERFQ